MRKRNNKSIRYIAAIAMSLFSLIALFTSTLAWFNSVRARQNQADDFGVERVFGKFNKVTFHILVDKEVDVIEANNFFQFDKEPVGTITKNWNTNEISVSGNTSIILSEYKQFDQEQPLLLLFELTSEIDTAIKGPVKINARIENNKTTGFLGEKKIVNSIQVPRYTFSSDLEDGEESLLLTTINNVDYYPLSSVAKFHVRAFNGDEFDTFKRISTNTYDFTIGDTVAPGNFVTINSVDESSRFVNEVNLYNSGNNTKVQYVALIIDYYPEAIQTIYTTYLANDYLETVDYILNYICDWSIEVV